MEQHTFEKGAYIVIEPLGRVPNAEELQALLEQIRELFSREETGVTAVVKLMVSQTHMEEYEV